MITVRLEGIEEARKAVAPGIVTKAAKLAINEAESAARKAAKKEIRAKWNIKPAKVNQEIKRVKVAQASDLTAIVQAKGRPISLAYFGAREIRRVTKGRGGKYRQAKGVTVQIVPGIGKSYPRAFMATMASGYRGVFMNEKNFFNRSGYQYHMPTRGKYAGRRGRTGIVSMSTITIASMFSQERVVSATTRAAQAKWVERFDHHMKRLRR